MLRAAPARPAAGVSVKKEARLLLKKSTNSLVLSVEHFNRPWDAGRSEAVLVFLDHAFEMLLKAAIVHRGGQIRERRAKQTIGFGACIRRALSDGSIKFITEEQAFTLQAINSLRDAAQHYLLDISENHLYLHAQSGLTLFRDLLKDVFDGDLSDTMPERVLPVSTSPPMDLCALFDQEVEAVRRLLRPGYRRGTEAAARLRSIAIVEGSIQGEKLQPGMGELRRLMQRIRDGAVCEQLFPGVSSLTLVADGEGPSLSLRITKRAGVPVHIVPEGTPGATVVAVRRVDELGYYSMGRDQLAASVGLTGPKTTALVWHLNLKGDDEYHKQIRIGASRFDRYSQKAAQRIRDALNSTLIEDIWGAYQARHQQHARPRRRVS